MAKPTKRLTLGAGEEINIPGLMQFVRIIQASGPVSVWVSSTESNAGHSEGADLVEGRAYRFRSPAKSVYIKNTHTAQQVIDLIITLGDIEDNTFNGIVEISRFTTDPQIQGITDNVRANIMTIPDITISPGEVVDVGNFPAGFNVNNFPAGFNVNNFPAGFNSVVTNEPVVHENTLNSINQRHYTGGYSIVATATAYCSMELWNDGTTGKTIKVYSAKINSSLSFSVLAGITNTPTSTGVAITPTNKYMTGPAAVGSIRRLQSTASGSTAVQSYILTGNVPLAGNQLHEMINGSPIILPPGYGLFYQNQIINQDFATIFEWEEIPV